MMPPIPDANPQVMLYTDGACSGNPGPGGWGAVLVCGNPPATKEISGAQPETTNNRMEMTAVIQGLAILRRPCDVTIVTDSQYVAHAFQKNWIKAWQAKGWRKADKEPVKNVDLWKEMLALLEPHQVQWQWVRGHAGHPQNERCDQLAVEAIRKLAR